MVFSESGFPNWRNAILHAPGLYLGRAFDSAGLHFLIIEIIRQAVNPDNLNRCTWIQVSVGRDGSIRIEDNGRGLPVTPSKQSPATLKDLPVIELVVTHILRNHPDQEYYEEYGFLDYLAVVLNAVSAELVIQTQVSGNLYELKCARGTVIEPLRRVGDSTESGTSIQFWADPEVFAEPALDVEIIKRGCMKLAKDYPSVKFVLRDGNGELVKWYEASR